MHKVLTLLFLRRKAEREVLLGLKLRGFGQGKWNGFGGKVEVGETIAQAAMREMQEESGVTVERIDRRAMITFDMTKDGNVLEVHVFEASSYTGEVLEESDEMQPKWFKEDELPFDEMWLDDRYWLPRLLAGERFRANFVFAGHDCLVSHSIEPLDDAAFAALPSAERPLTAADGAAPAKES